MARKKGLQASIIKTTSTINKAIIETSVLEEFKEYVKFSNVTSLDEALEQSMIYIMADDPDWKKENKPAKKKAKVEETV